MSCQSIEIADLGSKQFCMLKNNTLLCLRYWVTFVARKEMDCIHLSICSLSTCLTLSLYYALYSELYFPSPSSVSGCNQNVSRCFSGNLRDLVVLLPQTDRLCGHWFFVTIGFFSPVYMLVSAGHD